MPTPVVAIIGRPNVGKSTLFNRLLKERRAIVQDMPGVTRDRNYGMAELNERQVMLIDTGGFDPTATDDIYELMRHQADLAMEEADVVVVLFDGKEGLLPADKEIATLIRKRRVPVIWAVNKVDGKELAMAQAEFYSLGVDKLITLSSAHGYGVADLVDAVTEVLPEGGGEKEIEAVKVAIVGKPNVGKSTLVNLLAGKKRMLTYDSPGTTRDAIDTLVTIDKEPYLLIDTAGIRRKRKIDARLEKVSVYMAFKSIERADIVVLLLDATQKVTDQDARIAEIIAEKGKACIIVLNKWDAVEKDHQTAKRVEEAAREKLRFMPWAEVVLLSALTSAKIHRLKPAIDKAYASYTRRVGTGELNRFIKRVMEQHQAPVYRHKPIKVYYATQAAVMPPRFILFTSQPQGVHQSYRRYILNQLRAEYGFTGSPIKIQFKKAARSTPDEVDHL